MTKNTLLPYNSKQYTKGSEWWDRRNRRNSLKTQIEMNILLATLLELELTGTLENIGGQIFRLATELDNYFSLI